jgi:threonine dehydrogenase-like Zn-dependent dehydrogenase
MNAITVEPNKPHSARWEPVAEPDERDGLILVEAVAAGVLKNNVVFGSVNANKRHWYTAAEALARADRSWLSRLITRRVRPENFREALARNSDDIKVVIQFSEV